MSGKFLLFIFLDFDTFRMILSFLKDNNLYRIKAIVWNINPTNQEDDLIAKQASLINLSHCGTDVIPSDEDDTSGGPELDEDHPHVVPEGAPVVVPHTNTQ